ncbi:hypothetical protein [Streptomyces cahuitamycinicus]|nr:hypothetical protein [Streptomyces cahuitamycinicus]
MTIGRTESIQSGVLPLDTRGRIAKQHGRRLDAAPIERRSPRFD